MADTAPRIAVVARDRDEASRLLDTLVAAGADAERIEVSLDGDAPPPLEGSAIVVSSSLYAAIEATVRQARDAVAIVDANEGGGGPTLVYANERFLEVAGLTLEDALGHPAAHVDAFPAFRDRRVRDAMRAGRPWEGEVRGRRVDGAPSVADVRLSPARDERGRIVHWVLVQRDVTAEKEHEAHLAHLAHHDALTGLPNRKLFRERLDDALARSRRDGGKVAVLFLDLDKFKRINDSLGHGMGDRVLRTIADRLRTVTRATDTVARLGGDEFVLVLPGVKRTRDAERIGRKVLSVVGEPLQLDGVDVVVTPSVGIALYPEHGPDVETLLWRADHAMYRAKERGQGNVCVFTSDLGAEDAEHAAARERFASALERGELVVCYQPIVHRDGHVVGAEALLRWRDQGRLVAPAVFLPMIEQLGNEAEVGAFVLRTACAEAARWHAEGHRLRLTVNLFAGQLVQPDLVESTRAALATTGLDPTCLELEAREDVLLDQAELSLARLRALRRDGVRVSVDDFGTGHLSLHHLRVFPVDTLKIDRTLVAELGRATSWDAAAVTPILRAAAALAEGLGLELAAEGVETEEQREALRDLGCQRMQGWLFDRAMSAAALRRRLRTAQA